MNTDTQKTWTLRLTATDTVVAGIPHDKVASLLWQAMHGYGSLEQLAAEAVAHDEPRADPIAA